MYQITSKRIEFKTSTKGGSNAGEVVTGAKCLLFFDLHDQNIEKGFSTEVSLESITDKTLCSDVLKVTVHAQEDFAYQVKDTKSGALYGTKIGHPILEFTPMGLAESKGKDKYRHGLVITRVFKLTKHNQRIDGSRNTTYSFGEANDIVFAIHMLECLQVLATF